MSNLNRKIFLENEILVNEILIEKLNIIKEILLDIREEITCFSYIFFENIEKEIEILNNAIESYQDELFRLE